jgi:hypothetical protein
MLVTKMYNILVCHVCHTPPPYKRVLYAQHRRPSGRTRPKSFPPVGARKLQSRVHTVTTCDMRSDRRVVQRVFSILNSRMHLMARSTWIRKAHIRKVTVWGSRHISHSKGFLETNPRARMLSSGLRSQMNNTCNGRFQKTTLCKRMVVVPEPLFQNCSCFSVSVPCRPFWNVDSGTCSGARWVACASIGRSKGLARGQQSNVSDLCIRKGKPVKRCPELRNNRD